MNDYSQYGEAAVVAAMFPPGFIGRIADIGGWDPIDKSNSRGFIEAGWSALICEMSPGPLKNLIKEYGRHPNVKIVASAITWASEVLPKFEVTDDAVTTSNIDVFDTWKGVGAYYGAAYFATTTVRQLFLKFNERYDIVSIDAEGTSIELLDEVMKYSAPIAFIVEHDNKWDRVHELCGMYGYEVVPHPPSLGTNAILRRRG